MTINNFAESFVRNRCSKEFFLEVPFVYKIRFIINISYASKAFLVVCVSAWMDFVFKFRSQHISKTSHSRRNKDYNDSEYMTILRGGEMATHSNTMPIIQNKWRNVGVAWWNVQRRKYMFISAVCSAQTRQNVELWRDNASIFMQTTLHVSDTIFQWFLAIADEIWDLIWLCCILSQFSSSSPLCVEKLSF